MRLSDVIKFQKALALAASASNPFEAEAAERVARRLVDNGSIDPTRVPNDSCYSRLNFIDNELLKKLRDEHLERHPPKRIVWRRGIKGARLPRNTVLVTRPSRWGNPFVV